MRGFTFLLLVLFTAPTAALITRPLAERLTWSRAPLRPLAGRATPPVLQLRGGLGSSNSACSEIFELAKSGVEPGANLLEAMQGFTAAVGDFKPEELANLAWALATLGVKPDAGLLKTMQQRAKETAGDFTPQEGTKLMQALATLGATADAGLLEAMQDLEGKMA